MESRKGTLYSVGVGPGDPELLTLKAARIIEGCPVLAAPRTNGGRMLALDIVRQAVSVEGKTLLPLELSMTRDEDARRREYQTAAEAIAAHLAAGRDVALLNLGDVSVYASCGYVREKLKARGWSSVMVPGVPSFCAAAARLDESLTDRDLPLHLIPVGAADLEEALSLPGTKVLMKPGKRLDRLSEALRHGAERAVMVANCGLPEEQIWRGVENFPAEGGYFTTIIVNGGSGFKP